MEEIEKKNNVILDMRKVYVDVSSIMNKNFKKCIKNKDFIICLSELTILEIKNEKVYKGIPNEKFINKLIDKATILKLNDNVLKLAKFFVDEGIIPKEQYNDALHISIAKYYRCYTIMYDKESLLHKNIDFRYI